MDGKALGLVETLGLVPAIEGADAAVKSADVELKALEMIGAGLVTIVIVGDISAVSAGVDAGKAAAERLGKVLSTTVIGRTGEGLETVLCPQPDPGKPEPVLSGPPETESQGGTGTVPGTAVQSGLGKIPGKKAAVKQTKDLAGLRNMSVVKLRQFARKLPGLSLAQKKIKYARKKELIEAIVEHHRHEEK